MGLFFIWIFPRWILKYKTKLELKCNHVAGNSKINVSGNGKINVYLAQI